MGLLNGLRRLGYGRNEMCIHGFRAIASTLLNGQRFCSDVVRIGILSLKLSNHKEPGFSVAVQFF